MSQCPDSETADMGTIDKEQVGTKFGATLEAIDVTGDGVAELFVSAPLYSVTDSPEEGRVFLYKSAGRVSISNTPVTMSLRWV